MTGVGKRWEANVSQTFLIRDLEMCPKFKYPLNCMTTPNKFTNYHLLFSNSSGVRVRPENFFNIGNRPKIFLLTFSFQGREKFHQNIPCLLQWRVLYRNSGYMEE